MNAEYIIQAAARKTLLKVMIKVLSVFFVFYFFLPHSLGLKQPAHSNPPFQNTGYTDALSGSGGRDIPFPMQPARVSNVQVITPRVWRYGKFEARFRLFTPAVNLSLPFDGSPPAGIEPGIGATVDVLFSRDAWRTVLVQPAFFDQPFVYSTRYGRDYFVPDGPPVWSVRFTPQLSGSWQYRIRVQDSAGTSFYPAENLEALSFTVNETLSPENNMNARRGFLRVSPTDPRYFEFQNGDPFIGVGFNDGFDRVDQAEQKMQAFERNKINFIRVWMSSAGINGSQWSSWGSHHLPMDGYIPPVSLDIQTTFRESDVAWRLDQDNPCLFADFWQGGIPVEPDTSYTVWARIKTEGVLGPADPGKYGFIIKEAGWLDKDCTKPGNGKLLTQPIQSDSGWITVSGTVTTGERQNWLDYLYLTRQNATQGKVLVDEVRLWRSDDPAQTNLLREPYANSHLHFDPVNSARWDKIIESAGRHGVYLKLVIDEKNEWIRNHLLPTGGMSLKGSNNNFYGMKDSQARWLHRAWWRYLIARWGYSTAIHSFEFINEGDPNNDVHYTVANAMARYFHENDPSWHLASTSFWTSFPNFEFWSNPSYPDIDYADLHAYISTGWGETSAFLEKSRLETNPEHVHSAPASARLAGRDNDSEEVTPRGLVLRGAGEWVVRYWMQAENFRASCPYGTQGGMQRIRWVLDGGNASGGREGVVPPDGEGKDFVCTSPSGTFNWREFRSDLDRDGQTVPSEVRLILDDNLAHEFVLRIENQHGEGGTAWIDDIDLLSPSGEVVEVLGRFDTTPLDEDTAWYNYAYGEVYGGSSRVGARKPLVRGEAGITLVAQQTWNRELLNDKEGIWLHNNVWGQMNYTGMYDLFWWAKETIPEALYFHYLTYQNFMEGISLSDGNYRDAAAQTSSPFLRAWGQRNDTLGQMHLWVQNTQHTWKRVVQGLKIQPVAGTITIPNVPAGRYQVEWWDTYRVGDPVFQTERLTSDGSLILTLPGPLTSDVAVKIHREVTGSVREWR